MSGVAIEATELIDDIVTAPNLDDFMRRDPASLTAAELSDIVRIQRENRAQFIAVEEKKAMKKQGLSDE